MKKTIGIALGLVFLLSSCSNESYVSLRHPDAKASSPNITEKSEENESTEIQYTRGDEDTEKNDTSSSNRKEEKEIDENTINFTVEDSVNMRLAPSTNSDIVIEIEPESELLKIGENGDWTRITYDGYTGYILTELLVPAE